MTAKKPSTRVEKVKEALDELEAMESFDFAEAEVVFDNIASALKEAYLSKDKQLLGNAPSLRSVLVALVKRHDLERTALVSLKRLEVVIENTYDVDDETCLEWAREHIDDLVSYLRTFIDENPKAN